MLQVINMEQPKDKVSAYQYTIHALDVINIGTLLSAIAYNTWPVYLKNCQHAFEWILPLFIYNISLNQLTTCFTEGLG